MAFYEFIRFKKIFVIRNTIKRLQKEVWGITFGWIRSFNKEHQEKSPIQIPYHIKVSLQEYYKDFDTWPIPDFSDKCPICGGIDCATFLGYYIRIAICPLTGFLGTGLTDFCAIYAVTKAMSRYVTILHFLCYPICLFHSGNYLLILWWKLYGLRLAKI